jgi:hypothetical protein
MRVLATSQTGARLLQEKDRGRCYPGIHGRRRCGTYHTDTEIPASVLQHRAGLSRNCLKVSCVLYASGTITSSIASVSSRSLCSPQLAAMQPSLAEQN